MVVEAGHFLLGQREYWVLLQALRVGQNPSIELRYLRQQIPNILKFLLVLVLLIL